MNKTKNRKLKHNATKKIKINKTKTQDDIPTKMGCYVTYIKDLKQHLVKSLFMTKLPKITQKQFELPSEVAFDFAHKYYETHENDLPCKYVINPKTHTSIQYSAKNDQGKTVGIAKGTFNLKNNPQIVNFYQITTSFGTETYRFGTPVYTFKNIQSIVKNVHAFGSRKKNLINISLLSPCNTKACQSLAVVAKPLSKISGLFQKGLSATKEDAVIKTELTASNKKFGDLTYYALLFPLSSQTYTGVGSEYMTNIQTYQYNQEELKQTIKNDKVSKMYDYIELNNDPSGEKAFKSIAKLAIYYYLELKDEYILSYHCKSGKDRTSVFDSIVQSSFYYMATQKHAVHSVDDINSAIFKQIKNYAKQFMLYGFLIAFYSTGVIGLKLKNITIAKYIFNDDKSLLEKFIGHSSMVSS